jgi:acyl-CoA thioesterase-1
MVGVYALLAACSSEPPPTQNAAQPSGVESEVSQAPARDGKLVLALGDSLYAGYGLAPDKSFPAQLERALEAEGLAVKVHNAGVSGDTSAAGLQRLDFTLQGLSRKPDLALVGFGGNDMLRGLDPAATRANLLAICSKLRGQGIQVLLTGMLAAPNLGEDYGQRFNAVFPDVAKSCGATLYGFFLDGVVTQPELMLADRIHPNDAGVARIVEGIGPTVAGRLREQ